ncbi:hypothetical protein K438DRAFT_1774031 [Mycena galopus ATCC 62051]|nr:hypothetical protein K438DRAFT_1774031 [Mycena galopus ATCC 62051]
MPPPHGTPVASSRPRELVLRGQEIPIQGAYVRRRLSHKGNVGNASTEGICPSVIREKISSNESVQNSGLLTNSGLREQRQSLCMMSGLRHCRIVLNHYPRGAAKYYRPTGLSASAEGDIIPLTPPPRTGFPRWLRRPSRFHRACVREERITGEVAMLENIYSLTSVVFFRGTQLSKTNGSRMRSRGASGRMSNGGGLFYKDRYVAGRMDNETVRTQAQQTAIQPQQVPYPSAAPGVLFRHKIHEEHFRRHKRWASPRMTFSNPPGLGAP